MTADRPDGTAEAADPTDPPPEPTGSARRLVSLVIVALLALLFLAVFGGQIGRLQPGLGDPQVIYGQPAPSTESAS